MKNYSIPVTFNLVPPISPQEFRGQHDITFRQACVLGFDYLSKLGEYHFGGFINKSDLKRIIENTEGYQPGIMFYNCFDKRDLADKKLFLAYKGVKQFIENDPQLRTGDLNISRGTNYFKSETVPVNLDEVKNNLMRFRHNFTEGIPNNPATLNYNEVKGLMTDFEDEFTALKTKSYHYMDEEAVQSLINNDCVGVNYYFGFDETENDSTFKIFFVGVNSDGSNYIYDNNLSRYCLILERSWP